MGGKKKKGKGGKKGKSSEPRPEVSSAEQMAYKIQSLEAQLESARERVKRLGHDNEELRRTREKVEKDTHEFVAYFQKEMEKKDDLVADLRYNLRQAELSASGASGGLRCRGLRCGATIAAVHRMSLTHVCAVACARGGWRAGKEKELRETRQKLTSAMESKDNEYSATDRELRLRLKTVEEDLSMLYDFKAHKKELEAKLRDQEQQLIEKDLFHQKKVAAIERKYIEEKGRMQKEHDKQLKMIKRRSREEAQKDLDSDTRRIITDNRRMVRRAAVACVQRARVSAAGTPLGLCCTYRIAASAVLRPSTSRMRPRCTGSAWQHPHSVRVRACRLCGWPG